VLVPSLTVIVLLPGIPRVNKDVLGDNGTVPVPVAGEAETLDELEELGEAEGLEEFDELEELDELDEVELDDDEDAVERLDDEVPCTDCSALCTAAVSWLLTRSKAVWLAMLANPLDRLVIAEPITEMSASLCASDWSRAVAWFQ